MSVLLWVLGLSLDNVSAFLRALGCGIAKSTAWENLQAAGEEAGRLRKRRPQGKVRVIGVDTTVYKIKGEKITTGMITDGESGAVIEVEILESKDEEGLKAWLGDLVALGVEVLISDDDDTFKAAADDLGLKHQVCISHVRRWVNKRTRELIEEAEILEAKESDSVQIRGDPEELIEDCLRVKELVRELNERGPPELERLHLKYVWADPPLKGERASPWYRMRILTLKLWNNWNRLVLFQKEPGLDGTNNVTERAIGRCGKVRYRMMRGYKSRKSWKLTHELFAWLGEEGNGYRLGEVVG
jgi:transposase-like protein